MRDQSHPRITLKKAVARRLPRLTPIKTNHYSDPVTHLLGEKSLQITA
jgi:hypothetical protein